MFTYTCCVITEGKFTNVTLSDVGDFLMLLGFDIKRRSVAYTCMVIDLTLDYSEAKVYLENNRWFSAVLLCIYGDNHTRVVPYFESCIWGPYTTSKIWYNPCMIIRRYTAKQLKTIYYSHSLNYTTIW